MKYTLYGYWRSSCSWRVRWAMLFKGLDFETIPIDLRSGEQLNETYRNINPAGKVPSLKFGSNTISESMAIVEYLEETHPTPSLLPADPISRAKVRQIAGYIGSGIQPLQNLSVIKKVSSDRAIQVEYAKPWIETGLKELEQYLMKAGMVGEFSCGNQLTFADLFLIPQLYNARRFEIDVSQFEILSKIESNALATESGQKAIPERQIDAQ